MSLKIHRERKKEKTGALASDEKYTKTQGIKQTNYA